MASHKRRQRQTLRTSDPERDLRMLGYARRDDRHAPLERQDDPFEVDWPEDEPDPTP